MNDMTPRGHDQAPVRSERDRKGIEWLTALAMGMATPNMSWDRAEYRIDSAISETGAAPANGAFQLATPGHCRQSAPPTRLYTNNLSGGAACQAARVRKGRDAARVGMATIFARHRERGFGNPC
jgi:hypothetical protein